jgi:hypothetical protein
VLHASVLLHDLGLTPRFHPPALRFEVASADAARDLVRAHAWTPARTDQVWDVAVLHATGGIADGKSPETAVAADAIGTDVTGLGLDRFAPDGLARIMATRPGFARPFIDAVVTDLRDKPQAAASAWMAAIAADHIPGFGHARVQQLALAHPFETVKSQAQAPWGVKTARVGVDPDSLHRGGLAPAVPRVAPAKWLVAVQSLDTRGKRCEDSSSATPCHWTATTWAQAATRTRPCASSAAGRGGVRAIAAILVVAFWEW